eukprot:459924-Amphidinium_carterae.1
MAGKAVAAEPEEAPRRQWRQSQEEARRNLELVITTSPTAVCVRTNALQCCPHTVYSGVGQTSSELGTDRFQLVKVEHILAKQEGQEEALRKQTEEHVHSPPWRQAGADSSMQGVVESQDEEWGGEEAKCILGGSCGEGDSISKRVGARDCE